VREAEPQPVNVNVKGLDTKTLAGRLSVREAWVSVTFGSGLLITMASWLVCPTHTVPGLKLLLTDGVPGALTRRVALAGVVLVMLKPPPVALKFPAGIVLMWFPAMDEVTWMDTVHEPGVTPDCAGTTPPVRETLVDVVFTVPLQVLAILGGLAIETPAGRLSVQLAFVKSNEFGLKMLTISVEVPPALIVNGSNLLLTSAGNETWANAAGDGIPMSKLTTITMKRKNRIVLCIVLSFLGACANRIA